MTYKRFRPADLLLNPRDFGRAAELQGWVDVDVFRPEDIAAALLQHSAAWEVRAALGLHDGEPEPLRRVRLRKNGATVGSLEELASVMGESSRTLERKLNGQAAASLSDLAGWAYHLNWPMVWPAVQDRSNLMRTSDEEPSVRHVRRTSSRWPVQEDEASALGRTS